MLQNQTRREFLKTSVLAAVALALPTWASPLVAADAGAKFRLGLVTYQVGSAWDLDTLLGVCKAAEIAAVELRTTHKHGVEISLSADARKEVKKKFAGSGVELWGLGSVCEFQSDDPKVVDKNIETCKQWAQLAADVGAKGVKVRPNGLRKDLPVEKTPEQIGRALIPCGEAAKNAGVQIWVEVHGPGSQDPKNIKGIMEQCGHPSVGLTWNSNPTDVKNGSIDESFAMLKQWIRSCHINDLTKDASGAYPYRSLFKHLKEINYDGVTLCEVGKAYPDPKAGEAFLKSYKALWTQLVSG